MKAGCCDYSWKIISLSRYYVLANEEAAVMDTVLHEIAHALTPGDGHGAKWKAACVKLGAVPKQGFVPGESRSNGKTTFVKNGCKKDAYRWHLTYNGEIVHSYVNRPHSVAANILSISLKGKPESRGKLQLVQA